MWPTLWEPRKGQKTGLRELGVTWTRPYQKRAERKGSALNFCFIVCFFCANQVGSVLLGQALFLYMNPRTMDFQPWFFFYAIKRILFLGDVVAII